MSENSMEESVLQDIERVTSQILGSAPAPVDSGSTPSNFSGSSLTFRCLYDAFISFRGEDTRTNFVDHLYSMLTQFGIHTFRDDVKLRRGHTIEPELTAAIRDSRVSIVIFSKSYCNSSWCLDELVVIMESRRSMGQLVIPVFYHVDPSDVRNQTGIFKDAFAKYEETYSANNLKVVTWRDALREAGNLSGFHINGGHEAQAIRKIVLDVEGYLNHDILHVAKYPVGLESPNSPVAYLRKMLMTNPDDVKMVGIYGIGGIGKTTISKAFYNSVFRLFEGSCFLANVREESQRTNGLVRLQEKLLSRTLKRETFEIANVDQGICLINQRLCRKRVLIILDDVDNLNQLDSLAGDRNSFGVGSRIILTTRNKHLLNQAKVDGQFEVTDLVHSDALRLFSLHAFHDSEPLQGFTEISDKIVSYTRGHPLALEVIGASLSGKSNMKEWESTIQNLQKVPHYEVQGILKISFDALVDDMRKTIFLDISCFFIGMDKEQAVDIFDGCGLFGENGIGILNDRCLLTISKENKLQMHDLIRDMGREIVRAESPDNTWKRSRLWHHEDAHDVLKMHKGSEEIRGLVLYPAKRMRLTTNGFSGMQNLRLLQMDNVQLTGSFKGLVGELRWLRWRQCPLRCLPPSFCPEKLVYFDLQYSTISTLWQGRKRFDKLRILNLSYSKSQTTPDFTQVPGLEKLSLGSCPNLLKVHPSIGLLAKLIHLDLRDCNKLRSLPSTICNLTTLRQLDLDLCSSFDCLPEHLGDMKALTELDAGGTAIKQLPHSIGNLKKLRRLTLDKCNKNLEVRPWFSCLSLEILLQRPVATRFLPPTVSSLCSLVYLNLSECNLFEGDMSDNLNGLISLKILHLDRNNFCSLPTCLSQLSNLESLWLDGCKSLHSIRTYPPKLKGLYASNCISLKNLQNLSNLTCLEHLEFTNCCSLVEMHGLENLNSVLYINLEGCSKLTTSFENTMFEGYTYRKKNCTIHFPRRELPHWIEYKGSSIVFDVPLDVEPDSLQMTLWVNYASDVEHKAICHVDVYNRTTGIEWAHYGHSTRTSEAQTWVSHGPQPHPIRSKDKIEVSIEDNEGLKVEKCGVHLTFRTRV